MSDKFETQGWPLWNWVQIHRTPVRIQDAEEGELLVLLGESGTKQRIVAVVNPKARILKDTESGDQFPYTTGTLYAPPPLKTTGGRKSRRRTTRRRKTTHRRR